MKITIVAAILCAFIAAGCMGEKQEIVVLTKQMKKERETSTAVPDEFSTFAPASGGTSFWVEGTVKNEGTEDASNVDLVFKCSEGVNERVMVATLKSIPAGKTVPFKTKRFLSKYEVKLKVEEEEEIIVGK